MWVVIVLLMDIGIFAGAWVLYQKKRQNYDSSGLVLAQEPPAQAEPAQEPPPEPRRGTAPKAGRETVSAELFSVVPEKRPAAVQEKGAPAAPAARLAAPAPEPARRAKKTEAENFYFGLLRAERFRKSKVIQSWKYEFLSYPDLRAINHQYHKEGDPFKFLAGVARSENFQRMLGKYINAPDVQNFIMTMAGSPKVMTSASDYMADGDVSATLRKIGMAAVTPAPGTGASKPR